MATTKTQKSIKAIIDCLKKRRLSNSDLQEATGIAPRTLSRMLGYLECWGLAAKDKTGRWAWFENTRIYDTKQDLDIAFIHSKELIKGLNEFMASLGSPKRFPHSGERLVDKDKKILKEAAKEHLRTGYEDLYDEIVSCRRLMLRREDLARELSRFERRNLLSRFRRRNPEKLLIEIYLFRHACSSVPKKEWRRLERIIEKISAAKLEEIDAVKGTSESYLRLADAVECIIKKIESYEPLEGKCKLCPNVKVRSY
jgi:hypothetical protein